MPDSPDVAVCLRASGGPRPSGKLEYDLPTVQIIIRGDSDPRTGYDLGWTIFNALHGYHDASLIAGGIYVVGCLSIQSGPVGIGADENGRHEYTLNFEFQTLNPDRRA
jgi:hypothetical protein